MTTTQTIHIKSESSDSLEVWFAVKTARYLGMTTTELYQHVRRYKIPFIETVNGKTAFLSTEIMAWKGSREICPTEEQLINSREGE